ncbi:hypothetical protein Tco_0859471 [Tanacetum coccineum]|uniref:Zinc knuckle CX2CX4HX4C n=1 Tax=Tanacetum coccineum TaxID=301880 RepID=A0ABQ5BHT5_9ASTR
MEKKYVSNMKEGIATRVNLEESGAKCDGSPKVCNSSPLVSPTATINMPRGLYNIDVAATFRVPLTTVVDLRMLIKCIKDDKHDELLSRMTNDDRMVILDALGTICNSIKADNTNAVNSKADLVDILNIGIPSLTRDGFTKETIRVEYEWQPPRCDLCKIFGHVHDRCPNKVVSPPIVTTSNVVTPAVEKTNDGFQMFAGMSVKQNARYEPKVTTSAPKKGATNVGNPSASSSMLKTTGNSSKKDNIPTSNSYSFLNDDEEEEEEDVVNVYDETTNLSTKTAGSSPFTAAVG